ncbi:MAG: hypothetical protein E6G89_18250 [Alphaproteobacteria bacterium]|nr:MAG: hypothetical protein E6G89_18250 [Alphaproteobacteria bacterium]
MMCPVGDNAQRPVLFPIRHHSPACSAALVCAFDELRPRQVLIEAPVDFAFLIDTLVDPATRPPVAIVSLPSSLASGEDDHIATYPFCAHSPEFVALAWARDNHARLAFIDLPARHSAMRRHRQDRKSAPAPLLAEWRFDHNAYVAELCARRGVASVAALWDALFESQIRTHNWRGFFESVSTYCPSSTVHADVSV